MAHKPEFWDIQINGLIIRWLDTSEYWALAKVWQNRAVIFFSIPNKNDWVLDEDALREKY